MNKLMLIGNLTRDPEAGSTSNGTSFTRFTIAVNRPFANENGEHAVDFFDIVAWRQLADSCAKYLFKGNKVGVSGSVQRRQYEDRDGNKRTTFDVVANEVEFLSPKNEARENEGSTPRSDMQPVDDRDLPF